MFEALAAKDPGEVKAILDRIGEMAREQSARREKYQPTIRTQEERDAFAKYQEVNKAYMSHRAEAVMKPLSAGDRDLAAAGLRGGADRYTASIGALNNIIEEL